MALQDPPIEQPIQQDAFIDLIWVGWFTQLVEEINSGWTGSFTNGDGNTVTVENGKITDVS